MFDNIRLLKLDPRDYWRDLLGLFVLGFLTNRLIFCSLSYLRSKGVLSFEHDYFPLKLEVILIAAWLITYLFLRKWLLLKARPLFRKWSGERLFENRFSLDKSKLEEEWEFQGNIDITSNGLQITNTPSGCLIKNDYWDTKVWANLSATFEVDLTKNLGVEDDWFVHSKGKMKGRKYELHRKEVDFRKVLGIIFRAQSFDDYFMIGVWKVENRLVFRPHVRVTGNLDTPYFNPSTNTYSINTKSRLFQFKLLVKANKVIMLVKRKRNDNWKQCFYWCLPSFYKANLNEGVKNDNSSEFITRKIAFRNLPGQFGFRNYGNESALVKSMDIHGKFSEEEYKLFGQ